MTLHIGTILIAKEDRFMYGESFKPWAIKDSPYKIFKYRSYKDDYMIIDEQGDEHFIGMDYINQHFTIKRCTLSDLQTRTDLMVRIENEEQAKKLKDAGLDFVYDSSERYYGYTSKERCFIFLNLFEVKGRTLLESIEEIDLGDEGKEVLTTPVKVRTVEFLENLVREYESEIARLKEELETSKEAGRCIAEKLADEMKEKVAYMEEVNRLKEENELRLTQINQLKEYNEKLLSENSLFNDELLKVTHEKDSFIEKSTSMIESLKKASEYLTTELIKENQRLKSSQDLTKRERMAWEMYVHNSTVTIEKAFELVDTFLTKSKEVGNEK